jgi:hypothetical protein
VGAHIWERCDGQKNVAQIAGELAQEFGISLEESSRDCQEFIDGLVAEGLLEWQQAPEGSGNRK